jgi:SIR2-like domain/HEAT repeats
MNNPIAFLLGAGASYPYSVPMMAGFYDEFRAYVEQRHPHCFALLKIFERTGGHAKPDLETLLSDLQGVLGVSRGLALADKDLAVMTTELDVARELRGYLDAFIIDRCERFDREKVTRELGPILDLREVGPVWVFSTNYDRVIEHACEAHHVPWSDGFESGSPKAVADWTNRFDTDLRIVKLHGSVNWYEDDPGGELHRLDRGYSLPAYDFRLLRGDQRLRPLMIIPTLEKEVLAGPYIGLAMRFTDVLKESRILVVAGNSLRDRHIKEYIQHRLKDLHVLLVSPSASRNRDIFGVRNRDRTHALDAGFSEFLTLGGAALAQLARTAVAADDAGVAAAVEQFIADVSQGVEDAGAVSTDPDLARLWKQLDAESGASRVQAVKELAKHPHPAISRRLAGILNNDTSSVVRVAAIDSLAKLNGQNAATSLGDVLLKDTSPDVQVEAALALAHLGIAGQNHALLQQALDQPSVEAPVKEVIRDVLSM